MSLFHRRHAASLGSGRAWRAGCCLLLLAAAGCAAPVEIPPKPAVTRIAPAGTGTAAPGTAPARSRATQAPGIIPETLGPNAEDFPGNYNPLTGQPVSDPALLDLPAMLISVSNFPAYARPQAGLSFADYVFEFYITEGSTRFLSVFYGDFPKPEAPITGNCEVRMEPFVQTQNLLGNRVWLDANADGVQDFSEPGIGGVCANLYDAGGTLLAQTTTDSNGYYGFNVSPGSYTVEIIPPPGMRLTIPDAAPETTDSDAHPATGRMQVVVKQGSDERNLDAGLLPPDPAPTPDPSRPMPAAEVGPVRSGRLVYAHLAGIFQNSCLVYAFASEEVQAKIPQCAMVTHGVSGGGYMLPLERMQAIAKENARHSSPFSYASNLYTQTPPTGGLAATQIDEYFAWLNQSGWRYDPLLQSYLHYTDTSLEESAGQLHADTDRLNSRQLHFENVIILFTDHTVISPTNIDIDLEPGNTGPAWLFRDGQAYSIRWSTRAGDYEKNTGKRAPIRWVNLDGSLAALHPGHTWVVLVTPFSTMSQDGEGGWKLRFIPPEGAKLGSIGSASQ